MNIQHVTYRDYILRPFYTKYNDYNDKDAFLKIISSVKE